MKIYNSTQNKLLAEDVKLADNIISRTFGLIPKKNMLQDEGLIIKPCCSIHTFFMRFTIDVLFVDRRNQIVGMYENVKPWRILPIHLNSFYVIELASGSISSKNIQKGDIISLSTEAQRD